MNRHVSAVPSHSTLDEIRNQSDESAHHHHRLQPNQSTLEEGTYTLSAFANADWKNCYVVGTYTVDGITHTWYSDYDKVPASLVTDTVHARTLELESETAVTFAVKVCEGAELKNTKITPVLVEGEDVGNYYVGILGFLG